MFLLFLCLGTASVKAQVRIGGNTAPNPSAILDLNANDTNNGTKGLALPRVGLTSNTMLLPGVTANLTGMLVYNTSTTGGTGVNTIGIYYWNGATWVKASLPSTSAADSGKILTSNGSAWVPSFNTLSVVPGADTIRNVAHNDTTVWTISLDTTLSWVSQQGRYTYIYWTGLSNHDICFNLNNGYRPVYTYATNHLFLMMNPLGEWFAPTLLTGQRIRCYRSSR